MHVHGTAFGLADGSDADTVGTVGRLLATVGSETKGAKSLQVAANPSPLAHGRDHGIVVLMDDATVIDPYRAHPLHPEAGALLRANVTKGVGIDTGPMYAAGDTATDKARVHVTLFEPDPEVGSDVLEEVETHL